VVFPPEAEPAIRPGRERHETTGIGSKTLTAGEAGSALEAAFGAVRGGSRTEEAATKVIGDRGDPGAGGEKPLTELLHRAFRDGDADAQGEALERIYPRLRAVARAIVRSARPGETLRATDLVNEAFLRIHGIEIEFRDTRHFVCFAAKTMRRLVISHARSAARMKRGGAGRRLELDAVLESYVLRDLDPLAVDDALAWLATIDPELERVVELRHFGGHSWDEVAHILERPKRTIERRWQVACGLLMQRLKP
jgi:RNA polymerase sigma factor (TIGR02999 family)